METATGRIKLFSDATVIIPAGQTVVVDSFEYANFTSINYNISIKESATPKHKAFALTVTKKNGDVSDYIYEKTGDPIANQVNISLSGSDVIFEVTNNEVNDLSLFYRKNRIGE